MAQKIDFIQPNWKGRKIVRQLAAVLVIGGITLSLHYIFTKNDQGWTRESVIEKHQSSGPREVILAATVVFLTSGTTWAVPAGVTVVKFECIAASGGSGGTNATANSGAGSGAGAFAAVNALTVTPGANVNINVGLGGNAGTGTGTVATDGGDTWVNKTTNAAPSSTADGALAKGGIHGSNSSTLSPAGGAAASCVGDTKFSGGAGGAGANSGGSRSSGGGGGGAGGPNGAGNAGTTGTIGSGTAGVVGGSGDAGSGGAGGPGGTGGAAGTVGSPGAEYTATAGGTAGSGGGGGSASAAATGANSVGKQGGLYGAGASGATNNGSNVVNGAAGQPGLIVVTFTPDAGPFSKSVWEASRGVSDILPPAQSYNSNIFSGVPFKQTDWSVARGLPDFQVATPQRSLSILSIAPFSQVNWGKVFTPRLSIPWAQGVNIALLAATVAVPFFQSDWAKASTLRLSIPVQQPYNLALLTPLVTSEPRTPVLGKLRFPLSSQTVILGSPVSLLSTTAAAPFAQMDWSTPRRVSDFLLPIQAYNNLIYSGVPFYQTDWSTPRRVSDFLPSPQSYNNLVYSGVVTAAPFAQYDWSSPRRTPDFLPSPQSYNNLIYSEVPFDQADWSKSQKPGVSLPQAQSYNIALYTVTTSPFIPIDWSRSFSLRPTPITSIPFNPNLFTNPIPFAQFDWSKPVPERFLFVPTIQNYLPLTTVVTAAPFYQTNWSQSQNQRLSIPRIEGVNLALTTPVVAAPFYQTDWSAPRRVSDFLPPAQSYNVLIYSEVPFSQDDWSKAKQSSIPTQLYQPYNVVLLTPPVVISEPRAPVLGRSKFSLFPPPGLLGSSTALLSTPAAASPFAQYDWSKTKKLSASLPSVLPYNVNLYVTTVPAPFIPIDWSRPFIPRPVRVAPTSLNLNLFKNPIPFSIYDFSEPSRVYLRPGWFPTLNLSLTFQFPFSQTAWPAPVQRKLTIPTQTVRNLGLLSPVTGTPFAQLDWRTKTARRTPNYYPTPPVNPNLFPSLPANIKVRVYGRADDRSLSGQGDAVFISGRASQKYLSGIGDVVYVSGRASGVRIDGYPEPDAKRS